MKKRNFLGFPEEKKIKCGRQDQKKNSNKYNTHAYILNDDITKSGTKHKK